MKSDPRKRLRIAIGALGACVSGWAICQPALTPNRVALETVASLPEAVSNNAVTLVADDQGYRLVSAMGIGAGKTWRDISSRTWQFRASDSSWAQLGDVPDGRGRLAATAVAVAGEIYLFGGYTVAEDGSERSTPEVWRLNTSTGAWAEFSRMPVAVEDTVALGFRDRYVYLVSGWHDVGNVNLVQVLDTQTSQWQQATPWPGAPVFGHAGGIVDETLVVCDGVRIEYPEARTPRQFKASAECWLGAIDPEDHRRIRWRPIPPHPGPPRYRAASVGAGVGQVWFAGGAANPYNFDGVGYDGAPAEPLSGVISFDIRTGQWECHGELATATMDHRGLPWHAGWFYVIGGMRKGQKVSGEVFRFRSPPAGPC